MFDDLPSSAAWRHGGPRDGYETVFPRRIHRGWRFDGHTVAVEDDRPWAVRYSITVDQRWHTRLAQAWLWSESGHVHRTVRGDGSGRWEIDGVHVPVLDGCIDVDLEASACTNTFPVHRLPTAVGEAHEAPAAYVRVPDLAVERLEQCYRRRADDTFDYEAPAFDFRCRLRYDRSGLIIDYPGIAVRVR